MPCQQWQDSMLRATGFSIQLGPLLLPRRSFCLNHPISYLRFHVKLACDPYESGRSLFQEFTSCKQIFNNATNLLNHICASGDTSVIHGYLIHLNCYQTSKTTSKFWQLQTSIISQLWQVRNLNIIITIVHLDNNGRSIKTFTINLKSNG